MSGGAGGAPSGGSSSTGPRWIGRVDASNPNAVKFAWSATGFVALVEGSTISVKLQTEGSTSTAYFQPVIDGKLGERVQVQAGAARTVMLGQNLVSGQHTVELHRESEGSYGNTVFLGFVDGVVKGSPPAPNRLIEIIGDSISAGYGNLGTEIHPPWDQTCGFSLAQESAYLSYGPVLGRSLNAEVSVVAVSGWGMYRDNQGKTNNVLSSVYNNVLGTQPTPSYNFARKPDAVVINLGTNDSASNDPGQPYEDAYVAFLRTVRGHYPNAWLFLTIGPMTGEPMLTTMRNHLDNVVKKFADAKTTHITMDTQNTASTGCDYHPNVAEDARMAATLKTALQAKLAW